MCVSVNAHSSITIEPDARTRQLSLPCVLLYEASSTLSVSRFLSFQLLSSIQHNNTPHPHLSLEHYRTDKTVKKNFFKLPRSQEKKETTTKCLLMSRCTQ